MIFTMSIVAHNQQFAAIYLAENARLHVALTLGNDALWNEAIAT